MQHRQMLVIARPRRTMWVSMIGTLTQTHKGKKFEYGVKRYPELDNPVWFASEEDLDIIFDKARKDDLSHVAIGLSRVYRTTRSAYLISTSSLESMPAILGNTRGGKSCTVTALIRAVLDREMSMPTS